MATSILHEDTNWIVVDATGFVQIQNLRSGVSRDVPAAMLAQYEAAAPENRHDLITEWFHG